MKPKYYKHTNFLLILLFVLTTFFSLRMYPETTTNYGELTDIVVGKVGKEPITLFEVALYKKFYEKQIEEYKKAGVKEAESQMVKLEDIIQKIVINKIVETIAKEEDIDLDLNTIENLISSSSEQAKKQLNALGILKYVVLEDYRVQRAINIFAQKDESLKGIMNYEPKEEEIEAFIRKEPIGTAPAISTFIALVDLENVGLEERQKIENILVKVSNNIANDKYDNALKLLNSIKSRVVVGQKFDLHTAFWYVEKGVPETVLGFLLMNAQKILEINGRTIGPQSFVDPKTQKSYFVVVKLIEYKEQYPIESEVAMKNQNIIMLIKAKLVEEKLKQWIIDKAKEKNISIKIFYNELKISI